MTDNISAKSKGNNYQITVINLMYFMALVWSIFGVWSLIRWGNGQASSSFGLIIGIMMFGNAAGYAICAFGLQKKLRFFYVLSALLLVINIILTFTDEFGLFDLLTGLVDVAILLILFIRKRYFWKDYDQYK